MFIKLFFDADALIAASASSSGAAFILLQLCELGILKGYTCEQVVEECQKNLENKLPQAKPIFEKIILNTLQVIKNPDQKMSNPFKEYAHEKDLPILVSAINADMDYLVTFNTKHFYPSPDHKLKTANPGEMLQNIRSQLSKLADQ